jgi:two-component system, cell cycle sensor histidine kinase and response regulator CckA
MSPESAGPGRPTLGIARIVLPYVVVAGAWIYAFDSLVTSLLSDSHALAFWSTAKGWAFVAVTGTLLAGLMWREHERFQVLYQEWRAVSDALRHSEARYRLAMDSANAGAWEWDLATNENIWSDELWAVYGIAKGSCAASYESWRALVHPDDVASVEAALQARVAEAAELQLEWRTNPAVGPERWMLSRGRPLYDAAGKPTRYLGVVFDITALRASEERQRLLVEHAPAAIAMFDREMRYLSVSRRWQLDYGLGDTRLEGRSHYDVFPEIPESWREVHRRALAGEVIRNDEDGFERANGDVQWLRWEVRPWHDGKGQIGGIVIFSEDVTLRRQAEDQIRSQAALLDLAQDAIAVLDLDQRIRYWNRGAETLYGWTSAAAFGRPAADLFGPATPQVVGAWERLLESGSWAGEMTLPTRDGREVSVASRWNLVRDAGGKAESVLVIDTDISERKRLESQFLQAQKLESIGQLAGGIAHDYNNILAATMLQLELLHAVPEIDQEVRAGLNELQAATDRAVTLTRQLLQFSRRQGVQTRRVDLNVVLGGVAKMLGRLVGDHIDMVFEPSGAGAWVDADPGMVEQVVMNLVVNARDAMPKGGRVSLMLQHVEIDPAGSHRHRDARVGSFVLLRVRDAGEGMDESTLRRVFEPFFTTKEVGRGTGLGLASVYGIVQQHQGWVAVDSAPGKGSTFDVYLPAASVPLVPATEVGLAEPGRGHEAVLLVEDEPAVRRLASTALARLGYRVLEANTGVEALRVWEQVAGAVDVLVSDMVMPAGMTGLDLASVLTELKPDLKVLITSGYSDALRRMPGGTDRCRFLGKPFGPGELGTAVRDLLDGRSSEG